MGYPQYRHLSGKHGRGNLYPVTAPLRLKYEVAVSAEHVATVVKAVRDCWEGATVEQVCDKWNKRPPRIESMGNRSCGPPKVAVSGLCRRGCNHVLRDVVYSNFLGRQICISRGLAAYPLGNICSNSFFYERSKTHGRGCKCLICKAELGR